MVWTSDDLVTAVNEMGDFADGKFSTATILRAADGVILARATPLMRAVREDYAVKVLDYTVSAGTAEYRIPERASYGALRDVTYIDSNDNETSLPRFDGSDRTGIVRSTTLQGFPQAYVLEGDKVVLLPIPNETATLRMRYYLRPSRLVSVASCGVIDASATSAAYTVDVATVPSGFPATSGQAYFDIVQGRPNFDALVIQKGGTRSSSPSDRFSFDLADIPEATRTEIASDLTLLRTDYLCLAGETPVIPLPVELHEAVNRLTTAALCRSIADHAAADSHEDLGARELQNAATGLSPRVDGEDPAHVQIHSPLRLRRGGFVPRYEGS